MVRPGLVLAVMALATAALAQPSPRFYVDMVYVPHVGKVLVFGGKDDENVPSGAADTIWWWDPADGSWEAAAADGPSPRGGVAIAVHQPTGTVVLFGGNHGTRVGLLPPYSDTWLFHPDTRAWERLDFEPGRHPVRGFGRVMEYHAASDLFVLFGGYAAATNTLFNDTWHFDLAARTWVKVDAADPPRGRNYIGFTNDPGSERVLMYGQPDDDVKDSVVYSYDPVGQAWSRGEAALDPGGIDYYLHGGAPPTGAP